MALKSMKVDPQAYMEDNMACCPTPPEYPYGLKICLNDDSIKQLGLKELPKVGDVVKIMAIATVCMASENKEADGDVEQRLEVQITDMDMNGSSSPAVDANKMYPAPAAE